MLSIVWGTNQWVEFTKSYKIVQELKTGCLGAKLEKLFCREKNVSVFCKSSWLTQMDYESDKKLLMFAC